jgi:hypothetical protein
LSYRVARVHPLILRDHRRLQGREETYTPQHTHTRRVSNREKRRMYRGIWMCCAVSGSEKRKRLIFRGSLRRLSTVFVITSRQAFEQDTICTATYYLSIDTESGMEGYAILVCRLVSCVEGVFWCMPCVCVYDCMYVLLCVCLTDLCVVLAVARAVSCRYTGSGNGYGAEGCRGSPNRHSTTPYRKGSEREKGKGRGAT